MRGNTRVPWLPVNSIYTPASYRTDARLTKVIPIRSRIATTNLTLNFEAFNVSNSWSPTTMATQEYAETTKGVLTLTPTAWGYRHRRRRLPRRNPGAPLAGEPARQFLSPIKVRGLRATGVPFFIPP